ncbi:MAG: histidine phosphotransferase family protein [Paracoccaceae bacterium]
MTDRHDMTALIASRICHDLISPIGAIGNGVELLMMDSSARSPEVALIAESVASANARIRFFRVAFGAAGADQRIARSEVQDILNETTRGGRTQIGWTSHTEIARDSAKLAFLLLMCAESAMPYGGRIRIVGEGTRWLLEAEAPKLKVDPDLWEVLSNPHAASTIGPAQVHFALVPEELTRQGRTLTLTVADQVIRMQC